MVFALDPDNSVIRGYGVYRRLKLLIVAKDHYSGNPILKVICPCIVYNAFISESDHSFKCVLIWWRFYCRF